MNPFLQVMKRLLGWPYSTCTSGPTASKPSYANACLQDKLYRKVWKECGCVPTRILSGLASGNFSQNRPCNFFDYGFCASKIVKNFHWSASEHCIRAVFIIIISIMIKFLKKIFFKLGQEKRRIKNCIVNASAIIFMQMEYSIFNLPLRIIGTKMSKGRKYLS